ncbi:MAG TPA: hypothetical protein VKF42_09995 [Chitinivibrionales bacterium]|nr:hypothetical protein [Chitinivibrionales bacterium]
MIHRTGLQIVLAAAVFTAAYCAYIHPFVDTTPGNVWEFSYSTTSVLWGGGEIRQATSYGIVTITILPSGQVRTVVDGTNTVTEMPIFEGIGTSTATPIHDSSIAPSLRDLDLSVVSSIINPFAVDSMFPGDTSDATFNRVLYSTDTLFTETMVHAGPYQYGNEWDTIAYLQKYGLVSLASSRQGTLVESQSSYHLTLMSFSGKPFDYSQIMALNSVSISDMEKLYPAYAPGQKNAITSPGHRQSSLLPKWFVQDVSDGIELSFSTSAAFTARVMSVSGRELRLLCGDAGAHRVLLSRACFPAGMYGISLVSGQERRNMVVRIW